MANNDGRNWQQATRKSDIGTRSSTGSEKGRTEPLPRTPSGSSTGSSYVYPVRSLLANVEPAHEPASKHFETGDTEYAVPHSFGGSLALPLLESSSAFKKLDATQTTKRAPGDGEVTITSDRDEEEYNPRRPEPISSAGADNLALAYTTPSLLKPHAIHASTPLDFSKTGIVHLPPLLSSGSERSTSPRPSLPSRQHSGVSSRNSGSNSDAPRPSPVPTGPSATGSGTDSESDYQGRQSSREISTNSESELVTFKFQSTTNEHGHHVITGRDGRLTRCEDEPIRAPGAVQGFGVLIALEEDDETGNLLVRQVSENASELLGLSPEYLFSLECFTQTLPESQSDLLWDNVQFLHDSEFDSESEPNDNPQVFLLSGWGQPGSAISDDEEEHDARSDRRFWTCWCATHRPAPPKHEIPTDRRNTLPPPPRAIIVLEFELERDIFNPLYPPFQHEQMSTASPDSVLSGRSSSTGISSIGSSAGGSGSSTATTFSFGSGTGGSRTETQGPQGGPYGNTVVGDTTPATEFSPEARSLSGPPDPVDAVSINPAELFLSAQQDLEGGDQWFPSAEDVFESTTTHSKPIKALERMRRLNKAFGPSVRSGSSRASAPQSGRQRARARRQKSQPGVGTMDIFAVLAQVNDQLASAPDLESFLKVVVGVVKDLTQFHRVLVYQFDEAYNGQVVAELVDWRQTHDLYKGLHFPASDIPPQARELYRINKVRLLYNRSQATARMVVRSREDLDPPLDLTHSFLRAMSPFHVKYLENMGVRSSMSISIVTFGTLWGLISCHSYGINGMRVSFPVRQMLRLLSDSISRNIERLSYAQRLRTRKLISTLPTESHPTGYIVSNAEDLLGLFDADFGVLVIGEGAKILGPNEHGQEILLVAEFLRLKQFTLMQVSQSVVKDFPDLRLPSGLEVVAGLLCVPLSRGGKDFIAFLRKGQLRDVHWAGKSSKDGDGEYSELQPRKSFKVWSETIAGRCRSWTDEQLETAGILALVYGKFIEIWRERETALKTTQLTNLLLSNASHEVRTPLNHIINYLEMALSGSLDGETRENLSLSHSASKNLLFTINDLLVRTVDISLTFGPFGNGVGLSLQDLTRLESGNETSLNEPFDLHSAISDAVQLYRNEALRRNLQFVLDVEESPERVVGDARKIRTVISNLTANAVKFTEEGTVTVSCHKFREPRGLRHSKEVAVEIVISDTGCGIENSKLESIFREFEQVESALPSSSASPGLGLGLAVVARIVEQLGGQLRVDSRPNEGSRFSCLIPFELAEGNAAAENATALAQKTSRSSLRSRTSSQSSEIDSLVEALSTDHMKSSEQGKRVSPKKRNEKQDTALMHQKESPTTGIYDVADSRYPIRGLKVDEFNMDKMVEKGRFQQVYTPAFTAKITSADSGNSTPGRSGNDKLRILVVEDDNVNRQILMKRLSLDGHIVVGTTNGQEGVDAVQADDEFDCILMDIQMPVLNGFEATKKIRTAENEAASAASSEKPTLLSPPYIRASKRLNGRLPIFAVSASLHERQREELMELGIDGWILKPVDFKRLRAILQGILAPKQRQKDVYKSGYDWEIGGWLSLPFSPVPTPRTSPGESSSPGVTPKQSS